MDEHNPPKKKEALDRVSLFSSIGKKPDEIIRAIRAEKDFKPYVEYCDTNDLNILTGEKQIKTQEIARPRPTQIMEEEGADYRVFPKQRPTGKILNNSSISTYRFVAVSNNVAYASLSNQKKIEQEKQVGWISLPINEPKPNGYCAEISFTLEAEAPLLVGSKNQDDNSGNAPVVPVFFGNSQKPDWVIPGSTMRGMLRSAFETITFSRLTQYNRQRYFALRNFMHANYGTGRYPVADLKKLSAAWIRVKPGTAMKNGFPAEQLQLQICDLGVDGWYPITASNIIKVANQALSSNDFMHDIPLVSGKYKRQYVNGKYSYFGMEIGKAVDFSKTNIFECVEGTNIKQNAIPSNDSKSGSFKGVFVFSDAAPKNRDDPSKNKKVDYVFKPLPEDAQWIDLPQEIVAQFVELHSTRVDEKLSPANVLEKLLPTLRNGNIIPAFYVGDPANALTMAQVREKESAGLEAEPFAMGLTRLFRVPHEYSFKDAVEEAAGPTLPKYELDENNKVWRRDPLDMTEALFGYVYEPGDVLGISAEEAKKLSTSPGDFALKGRIAFSALRLSGETPANRTASMQAVLSTPKPSFAPYYLSGKWKDYSPPRGIKPKIAGRKAYLPRYTPSQIGGSLEAVKNNIAATLTDKKNVESTLSFLVPERDKRLAFEGKIRQFNVTAVEIGAILWTLTHGGNQETHRHMIGHARSLGAGQVKLAKIQLSVDSNDGKDRRDIAESKEFMSLFINHMEKQFKDNWAKSPTIMRFLDAANPHNGSLQDKDSKLASLKQPFDYGKIRELTQPMKETLNHARGTKEKFDDPQDTPLIRY